MRNIYRAVFLLLILVLALPGRAAALDDKTAKEKFEPILLNVMTALEKGDIAAFTRDFDDAMKSKFTREEFDRLKSSIDATMGRMTGITYLGFIEKKDFTIALWKGTFEKTQEEIAVKLVLSRNAGGDYQVSGLWFQ
jgi:hypothetical protein